MEKRLSRNGRNKMIGGVAAGLADYLNIDATVMRLLFILAAWFQGGGVIIYIILWIALPERTVDQYSEPDYLVNEGSDDKNIARDNDSSRMLVGWVLIGFGVFFLFREFFDDIFEELFDWLDFSRIWPVVFVVIGVIIITSAKKVKQSSSKSNVKDEDAVYRFEEPERKNGKTKDDEQSDEPTKP